jgi:hypothetical protein
MWQKSEFLKQSGFTFQGIGFITEPNRLGAKIDEMLHQRLLKKQSWKEIPKGTNFGKDNKDRHQRRKRQVTSTQQSKEKLTSSSRRGEELPAIIS